MGFTPCKAELPLRGMELQEKEAQKDYIIQEKRCVRLKATKIIGQRKAFHRQKIPGSSCARKEIVHTDILVTSGNGDRKIMQSTCWGCQIYQQPPRVKFNELKKTNMNMAKPNYMHILTEQLVSLNDSLLWNWNWNFLRNSL